MDKFQKVLTDRILAFRDARNWKQFHSAKDIAMSLSIESNEVLELFLWKDRDAIDKSDLANELSDVLYALLLLANEFDIDLELAFESKMLINETKYPVAQFHGSNKKADK